jgi:hypothetical protein
VRGRGEISYYFRTYSLNVADMRVIIKIYEIGNIREQ